MVILWNVFKNIAYQSTKPFRRYSCCRQIGIYLLDKTPWLSFKLALTRIFLEFYLDIGLASSVGLTGMLRDHKNFSKYFDGWANILNSVLTFTFLLIGTLFPLYVLVRLCLLKSKKKDGEDYEGEAAEEMIQGINISRYGSFYYNVYFVFRRFLTMVIVVYGIEY